MSLLAPGDRVAYLGPGGTFTHEAARDLAGEPRGAEVELVPVTTVTDVYAGVGSGAFSHGVVAIENSVEGYVVPSLDALVSAQRVVAVDETFVSITFDAFEHPTSDVEPTQVVSHPHGLAQCQGFVASSGLVPTPASSNAAACRDLVPGQVALGPPGCGRTYGLRTRSRAVEDFHGARTRFLLLADRDVALTRVGSGSPTGTWRSMLAITPHATGPGVLARITQAFGETGVNLSSLITRPLKALEGKYVFIVTVDGPPWDGRVSSVLEGLLASGDSVKTLGVFPARGELDDVVDAQRVPVGSVQQGLPADVLRHGLLWS